MKHWIFVAGFLIAGIVQCSRGQSSMEAKFHMLGVKGEATLTWAANTLTVSLQMDQSLGQTSLEIRPMWVNYDAMDKCSSAQLGGVIEGLSATANVLDGSTSVTFTAVPSLEYVEGHSLVLRYANKVVCATIQKSGDHVTAVVRFRDPSIFGQVYLRQASSSGSSTRLITDLATLTDMTMADWRISDSFQNCDDYMKHVMANIYNPTSSDSSQCSTTNQNACLVGDLSSKLDKVRFSGRVGGSEGRRAYTDTNLPLHGDNNVDKLLMIIVPNSDGIRPACGMVSVFSGRSAKATFSNDGITGTIDFTQRSPLDPTVTTVSLQGLRTLAGGYHVHLWPRPEHLVSTQSSMCAPERVSGHFNPFQALVGTPSSPDYPAPATSTYDMYEVGDLSGKYGLLNGAQSRDATYTDWNLQLYGTNSIVGRSLVIHRNDATSSRWVCVNIEPQYPVRVAEAVFTYPVLGHLMFMQEQAQPDSDTSVFSSLDYNDQRQDTQGHMWMIGGMPLGTDMMKQDVTMRCQSASSAYNPEKLWPGYSDRQYSEVCADNKPVACKTGDLSGKLGLLNIGNMAATQDKSKKWFATDTSLPLSGPHTIDGKAAVIRTVENTGSLACAEILPVHPISLVAEFTSGPVTGTVRFTQPAGLGDRQTMVETALTGMGEGHSLMIYDLPPSEGQAPCTNIGTTFDPLNVGDTQQSLTTDDIYKVGDLSRFAALTSWSSYNLPLSGPNSIKGRSVAVVDGSSTVLGCAKIEWDMTGWTLVKATATFAQDITGTISMYQRVYPDGAKSDTTILVDLEYANASQESPQHNWHTHSKPVSGDSQASTGRCSSTGPHYNPFMVDVSKPVYTTECSPENQLRCELGDQAKKTMPIDLKPGRKLFTDIYEPLVGKFSVQGRSIVVHEENKGAPRIACANIVPDTMGPVTVKFKTPKTFPDMELADQTREVNEAYAEAIRAYPGEVVAIIENSSQEQTTVVVHFVGTRSATLKSRFLDYINDDNRRENLGPYTPIINTAAPQGCSIILVLFTLISSVLFSLRT